MTNASSTSSRANFEPLEARTLFNAGDLDSAFGAGGRVALSFPGAPFDARAVALRADGKTIVAGTKGGHLAIVRLNGDGSLDTTFGGAGLFESNEAYRATDVALQADDKIVVTALEPNGGGGPPTNPNRFTTIRILADGEGLDTSFDGDGVVSRRYGTDTLGGFCMANAVAIQQDGKIIVGGSAYIDDIFSPGFDFLIARYNADGSPDATFGTRPNGVPLTYNYAGMGGSDEILDLAIDYHGNPSTNPLYGSIVAVGDTDLAVFNGEIPEGSQFAVARFRPDGTLDGGFDGDGKLTTGFGTQTSWASGVIIQPGGKIVATGSMGPNSGERNLALARYHPSGSLDSAFGPGNNGKVQQDMYADDVATGCAVSYTGGVLVAAYTGVAAFTADGSLDTRFSGDGAVETSARAGVATTGSAIAPVRKLVVAGATQVHRLIDVGPRAALLTGITETHEANGPSLNIIVGVDRMTFDQRVYIDISGSATAPVFSHPSLWDYSFSGIRLPGFNVPRAYVDIPAGQTHTICTITPINDTRAEGDETIELAVSPDETYDLGNPWHYTLLIRDDDQFAAPRVAESKFHYETAPQRVTFRFDQNVGASLSAGDFQVSGPGGSVPFAFGYDSSVNTATLTFSGALPDGNYTARAVATGITNGAGQAMAADHALDFFVLAADANRDRRVNLQDFNRLAANFGQSNRTFSQGDFNYDGNVTLQDFNILAARFGQVVAPAAAPPLFASQRLIEELDAGDPIAT